MPRLSSKAKRFLRDKLREMYGNRCIYCNRDLSNLILTIEHVIPRSQGGTNHIDNLRPACEFCNSTHANPLEADRRPKNPLSFTTWYSRRSKQRQKKQRGVAPVVRWIAPCFPVA